MSRRARLAIPLLTAAVAASLAFYAAVWAAVPATTARTSDYAGTYVAATLWRTGDGARMYDEATERRVLAASGAPANHLYIPFENPPAAAVLAAPVSLLDAAAAYRVWSLLQVTFLALAVFVVVRAAPWPRDLPGRARCLIGLLAMAGFGTGALLVEAQWDGFCVLGLGIGYAAWRGGHPARAGFAIGFTAAIAKPQLILGIVAFMAGRRDWRAVAGTLAGGALMAAISLVAVGPHGIGAFAGALAKPSNSPLVAMQGATGLFASLFGSGRGAFALALGAIAAACGVAARLGSLARSRPALFEPALAAATALSLFASPHLLGHDLTYLAPALVFGLAWLAGNEPGAGARWPGVATCAVLAGWLALSVTARQDLGNSSSGLPGRVTPWALLLVAMTWVVVLRRAPSASARSQTSTVAPNTA